MGMQKAQLTLSEIRLATKGVQQLRRCADADADAGRVEHQRHGIHGEIPARQI
jgi:hypothetical protein